MLNNNFLRRWPSDFDLLGPPRGFGADFYQEFERIKQNHFRRMTENFGYLAPFRYSFFDRERNFFERRFDFQRDFEPIRKDAFCRRKPILKPRVSNTHRILVDCTGYSSDSLKALISEDKRSLTVYGKEGKKISTDEDYAFKEFKKVFSLPEDADTFNITAILKSNGLLFIDVPLVPDNQIKFRRNEPEVKRCEDKIAYKPEEKTVHFQEKPLDPLEEQNIRTKITEESYYKKVTFPVKKNDFSFQDEIFDTKDKRNILIAIDSDNDSQINNDCNKNLFVSIPIQIVNHKQN